MQELSLQSNLLTSKDAALLLTNKPKLKKVLLSHNLLETLTVFSDIPIGLRMFSIDDNMIRDVGDVSWMKSLEFIQLDKNELDDTEIAKVLQSVGVVKTLFLSRLSIGH